MKKILTIEYDDTDLVRIVNQKQAHLYTLYGQPPLWVEAGYNNKIVFVFSKSATEELFNRWKNYELQE